MTISWSLVFLLVIVIVVASWRPFFDIIQRNPDLPSQLTRPRNAHNEVIHVFKTENNCGLLHKCPEHSFSIFLSTGIFPENKPNLCVNGKYVIKPAEKSEARGLNAAIVEPNHFEVVSVRNFDTYLYNKSVEISEWIDRILNNDIIIIFTYDEASTRLGGETKSLLNELGSGKIQNLQFRSQWYMITQKGTKGFTTYEKLTFSKKKNWGEKIEFRGCIPKKIPKKITTADEPLKTNRRKIKFCEGKTQIEYKGFCNEARFEMIMSALLTNKSLVGNIAYTIPIYIYASSNLEVFIASLDSLIHQPGVVLSLITVLYSKNSSDIQSVSKIYGVKSNETEFKYTFEEKLKEAKEMARTFYSGKKYLVVIDSDVIPSPDFLFFMAQLIPIVEKDKEVSVISGWSSNCYKDEGSVHLAYRIHGSPKYAALIPADERNSFYGDMFAPDVARVQGPESCHLPSLEPGNWIERPQDLLKSRYFHKMVMLQQLSQTIDVDEVLSSCPQPSLKNETNAIYIPSNDKDMSKLMSCLGVKNNQYGEYDGIVRLLVRGKTVLFSLYQNFMMGKGQLNYNCRLALAEDKPKTSTEIGLPYIPPRMDVYEKLPFPKLPIIRLNKAFKPGTIYTNSDGLKSTYNESYKIPIVEPNVNTLPLKLMNTNREYSATKGRVRPLSFELSEYREEYPIWPVPEPTNGVSLELETTCPMITTGRGEREPLPLTANYNKYLDIYLSTSRLAHRAFTPEEQKSIAMKDIVTSQETMDIPKERGFGCKFRAFPGQDLDNRDPHMTDKLQFSIEPRNRYMLRSMPKVPFFGSESEMQASFTAPKGYALHKTFAKFSEYSQNIVMPTSKQGTCPPGMYTTESYAINNHTSPQTVV